MLRLRQYLTDAGLWDEAQEKAWLEECGRLVDIENNAYLETKVQPVEAMFDYLYGDPPPDLLAQRAAAIALDTAALETRNGGAGIQRNRRGPHNPTRSDHTGQGPRDPK